MQIPADSTLDTIAAIATPFGEGGISVIRISGSQATRILAEIFEGARCAVAKMATHKLSLGRITVSPVDGEEVLAVVMRNPHSYTGEDIVEVHAHGGLLLTKNILDLVIAKGARLAVPGEFTKRAFLNGKIDLSRAEAVADIITAKTESALKIGLQQLQGAVSKEVGQIKVQLMNILAGLEAEIDYSEEGLQAIDKMQVKGQLNKSIQHLQGLADSYKGGKILKEGVQIALIGKPNAGKSSVFNCLIREEKAIVTPHPGTTRDIVEAMIDIKGIPIKLMDTAGIRESQDEAEKMGVDRTERAIISADLLIFVMDGSRPLSEEDFIIKEKIKGIPYLILLNKSDLPVVIKESQLNEFDYGQKITFSAISTQGIKNVEEAIYNSIFKNGQIRESNPGKAIISNIRHFNALNQAIGCFNKALTSMEQGWSEEFIVVDLKKGLEHLGSIAGEFVTEELLEIIFSKFCVGK